MQCLHSHKDLTILDIGGLLFLWNWEACYDRGLAVIDPDLTLGEVFKLVLNGPPGKVVRFYPEQPVGELMRYYGINQTWLWEMQHKGCNW